MGSSGLPHMRQEELDPDPLDVTPMEARVESSSSSWSSFLPSRLSAFGYGLALGSLLMLIWIIVLRHG